MKPCSQEYGMCCGDRAEMFPDIVYVLESIITDMPQCETFRIYSIGLMAIAYAASLSTKFFTEIKIFNININRSLRL
jgi:hypothetical protein